MRSSASTNSASTKLMTPAATSSNNIGSRITESATLRSDFSLSLGSELGPSVTRRDRASSVLRPVKLTKLV